MKAAAKGLLPVRRLTVRRALTSDPTSAELEVDCPLAQEEVRLQRCAFCKHGQGYSSIRAVTH